MGLFDFFRKRARGITFAIALGVSACASQSQIRSGHYLLGTIPPGVVEVTEAEGNIIEGEILGGTHIHIVDFVIQRLNKGEDLPKEIEVRVTVYSLKYNLPIPREINIIIKTQDIVDYIRKVLHGKFSGYRDQRRLQIYVAFLAIKATAHEIKRMGITSDSPY